MKTIIQKLMCMVSLMVAVVYAAPAGAVICSSIADVYIDSAAPDENFNDKTRILIAYHPGKGIARGLVKFDIPEEIDAFRITAATLHLSSSYHTGGGNAISVRCYALNAPFREESDTWNTLNGGDFDSSVSSSGKLPSGNDWETSIDLTVLAKQNLEKLRANGMLMGLQTEGPVREYQNIASRESVIEEACFPYECDPEDFAPYLDIEYSENTSSSTTAKPVQTSTTSLPVTSTTSSLISSSSTTTVFNDTTSILTSTTTTTRMPGCLLETIYGENSEQVVILKYIRDRMLRSTPEGRELVRLYYGWSPFLVRMIENDPEFHLEIKMLADEFLEMLDQAW